MHGTDSQGDFRQVTDGAADGIVPRLLFTVEIHSNNAVTTSDRGVIRTCGMDGIGKIEVEVGEIWLARGLETESPWD